MVSVNTRLSPIYRNYSPLRQCEKPAHPKSQILTIILKDLTSHVKSINQDVTFSNEVMRCYRMEFLASCCTRKRKQMQRMQNANAIRPEARKPDPTTVPGTHFDKCCHDRWRHCQFSRRYLARGFLENKKKQDLKNFQYFFNLHNIL